MLNIASVNMPKIKPESKVLIIKTLKSKSPAEVADIFNVSKGPCQPSHNSRVLLAMVSTVVLLPRNQH